MSNKQEKHCCDKMNYYCELGDDIEYDPSMRKYYLILHGINSGSVRGVFYCPWCGKKLPKDLNSKWDQILREEYGLRHPFFEDKDKVPQEFWTDEWWKKRGL